MKGKKENIQIKINKWEYEKFFEEKAKKYLIKKYDYPIYFHDIKVINDIIFNEKTHFVETFKEYLIYDDIKEFLFKFYSKKKIIKKLSKIVNFYVRFSKIYANYIIIPENKYMYKNIKRKQKMIDQIQNNDNNESNKNSFSNIIFTKNAINSINSVTKSIYNNNSDSVNLSNQSYNSINKLINQLTKEEEKGKKKDNVDKNICKKYFKNKSNNNENNYNLDYKKSIKKNNSKKKIISVLLSPKTKEKLLENNMNNKLKNHFFIEKEESKNKFDNNLKSEKIFLSANTNSSTKEFITKILFSPLKKQTTLKKKIPIHSSNILNYSNKLNMKHLVFSPKNFKHENYQKIFQNNNIDNLKHISGNKFNYSNKKRSKSNPQSQKTKINNINIINNIQNGTTQINIYTGNDFYKSLNINNNGNSNIKSNKSSIDKNYNNNCCNDLKKKNFDNNFEINIRKIIQKNILELESSSSKRNNEKKIFFKKLVKYFFNRNNDVKNNSMTNKLSLNGSSLISKIIKKKDSFKKNTKKFRKELSCSFLKYKNYKKIIYLNNSNLNKAQKN